MEIKTSWVLNKPIAHRGLHNFELPENTVPAFENAAAHGFAVELDVRLIDDQTVVVFHDEKLSRMTDRDGYVSNLTASDLKNIKIKKSEYGIPTLERVLEAINGKVPILIEVKKGEQSFALEEKIIDMLNTYNGDYAVQSFDPYSLEYFYNNAPQIMRGQLATYFHRSDVYLTRRDRARMKKLKYLDIAHPDFVAYNESYLPNKYVKNAGLPVVAWTVRTELAASKILKHCDNYIFEGFIPKQQENDEEPV